MRENPCVSVVNNCFCNFCTGPVLNAFPFISRVPDKKPKALLEERPQHVGNFGWHHVPSQNSIKSKIIFQLPDHLTITRNSNPQFFEVKIMSNTGNHEAKKPGFCSIRPGRPHQLPTSAREALSPDTIGARAIFPWEAW
jgi:hypothetical protein